MDKKQKGIFLYSIFLVLIIGVGTSFKGDWVSAALSGSVLILLVTIYLELDGKGL